MQEPERSGLERARLLKQNPFSNFLKQHYRNL